LSEQPTTAKTTADLVQDLIALGCEEIYWAISLPSEFGVLTYSRRCPLCGVEYDHRGEIPSDTLLLALLVAMETEEQSDRDDRAHGNVCPKRASA
jgi:hypothetical protein